MAILGAKGGSRAPGEGRKFRRSPVSSDVLDEPLRLKARDRLLELLDSDDEAKRLQAARALYSFGPARPPQDEDEEAPLESLAVVGATWLRRLDKLAADKFQATVPEDLQHVIGRLATRTAGAEASLRRWQEEVVPHIAALAERRHGRSGT
jgi:hypothetical protein